MSHLGVLEDTGGALVGAEAIEGSAAIVAIAAGRAGCAPPGWGICIIHGVLSPRLVLHVGRDAESRRRVKQSWKVEKVVVVGCEGFRRSTEVALA